MTDAYSVQQILGNRIAQTPPYGDSSQRVATSAFVQAAKMGVDVTSAPFNADPTGVTANFGAAFNAAMKQCRRLGALGIANNGTVYIPQGFYKIGSTVPVWLPGCNIVADPGAYIQANVSIPTMLKSGIGASNSLIGVSLEGGQWDGNTNVTDSGFMIPDFAGVHLHDFSMYGCTGNSGNGSIGGFIRLGAAGTSFSFEMHIENAILKNFPNPVPILISNNYGIFSDPSSTSGPTDSRFDNIEIVGTSIGVQGQFFGGIFTRIHSYVVSSQGNMVNGFKLTSGQCRLIGNQVDGPLVSGNAAYDLSGGPYTLIGNGYFEDTNDNTSWAVNVGSSVQLFSYGNHWIGNSNTTRIAIDYAGSLAGVAVHNDFIQNVVISDSFGIAVLSGTSGAQTIPSQTLITNPSNTFTLTLQAPSSTYPGATFTIKTIANFAVNSASSNVVPLTGGAAGSTILGNTAGKWATLTNDTSNWNIIASN